MCTFIRLEKFSERERERERQFETEERKGEKEVNVLCRGKGRKVLCGGDRMKFGLVRK